MHDFFSIGLLVLIGLCFFYRLETSAPGLSGYYWYIYTYFHPKNGDFHGWKFTHLFCIKKKFTTPRHHQVPEWSYYWQRPSRASKVYHCPTQPEGRFKTEMDGETVHKTKQIHLLVGGFNPNISQIGSFPQIGVNIYKTYLKPPPRSTRELTAILLQRYFWVDDFLFPKVGYLSFLDIYQVIPPSVGWWKKNHLWTGKNDVKITISKKGQLFFPPNVSDLWSYVIILISPYTW